MFVPPIDPLNFKNGKQLSAKKFYLKLINFAARFKKTFISIVILLFGLPIFYLPSEVEGWALYNETLGNEYYLEEVRPHIDKWLGGSLRMFVRDVFEESGYRDREKTVLHVMAEMADGHTLEQMDFIIRKFEDYLQNVNGLDKFITNIQSEKGAHISIFFRPDYEESNLPYALKNQLISRSLDWGGVEWNIYGVGKGFSNNTDSDVPNFRVEIRGYNYVEVRNQAQILAEKLLTHQRIQKINVNARVNFWERKANELVLRFDNNSIAMTNANIPEIVEELKMRSRPINPDAELLLGDQIVRLNIIDKDAKMFSKNSLLHDPIFSEKSKGISRITRINSIGSLQLEPTANTIHKENRLYIRHITFDYFGSRHFGNKYLDEKLAEMKAELPPGYSVEKLTFNMDLGEVKRRYSLIAVLIVLTFFICSILFENLKLPLIIISTVPVSFIGVFLVFALFDFYFDQGGYAAFLLLGGLVVNASIFVLSDYKSLRNMHDPNERLIKALFGKARPIMLTIISTIFGLSPFLIEGQNETFWFPLAIGTIGGLVLSLFALFIFLPVVMWKKV